MSTNIGPCECCGSSSSTTTGTTGTFTTTTGTTGTTGTFTTGTGTTASTTTGTTVGPGCCDFWADMGEAHPIEIELDPAASCNCGGEGEGELTGSGPMTDSQFEGASIVLCQPFGGGTTSEGGTTQEWNEGLILNLVVKCPSASSSGNWRIYWELTGECEESGEFDATYVDCDESFFVVVFDGIGGIPSADCCGGGTGSGTWKIIFSSS